MRFYILDLLLVSAWRQPQESLVPVSQGLWAWWFPESGSAQQLWNWVTCLSFYGAGKPLTLPFEAKLFPLTLTFSQVSPTPSHFISTGMEKGVHSSSVARDTVYKGYQVPRSHQASWFPVDWWWRTVFWTGFFLFGFPKVSERGKTQACSPVGKSAPNLSAGLLNVV